MSQLPVAYWSEVLPWVSGLLSGSIIGAQRLDSTYTHTHIETNTRYSPWIISCFLTTQHASVALIPVNMLSLSFPTFLFSSRTWSEFQVSPQKVQTMTQIVLDLGSNTKSRLVNGEKKRCNILVTVGQTAQRDDIVGKVMNRLVAMATGGEVEWLCK